MTVQETIAWYRKQAREQWDQEEECAVPDEAVVIAGEEGAWIEAWIWIAAPSDTTDAIVDVMEEQFYE